jgi:hypothetical protein
MIPFLQNIIWGKLMLRQAVNAIVQHAYECLDLSPTIHLCPVHVGEFLLEGGLSAHGDQQEFSERMHLSFVVPAERMLGEREFG